MPANPVEDIERISGNFEFNFPFNCRTKMVKYTAIVNINKYTTDKFSNPAYMEAATGDNEEFQ